MSEWGLPDWRDASAYGDVKRWNFAMWRWEFYRRRADIRRYFETHVASQDLCRDFGRFVRVEEEMRGVLGYSEIPDPRLSSEIIDISKVRNMSFYMTISMYFEPKWNIMYYEGKKDNNINIQSLSAKLFFAGQVISDETKHKLGDLLNRTCVFPEENEVCIVFNRNQPVDEQIKAAYSLLSILIDGDLSVAMGRPKKKKKQKRRHPKKWLSYLRALDAHEAGASYSEMASVFFAEKVLGRRKDPAGGYGPPPPQAARDLLVAADALRLNF